MSTHRIYLLRLQRALLWALPEEARQTVLADCRPAVEAAGETELQALYRRFGAPRARALQARQAAWPEARTRRLFWVSVAAKTAILLTLCCFLLFLRHQQGGYMANYPAVLCFAAVALPFCLWLWVDRGTLLSPLFRTAGEGRELLFWQGGILLLAAAGQLLAVYGPALLTRLGSIAWGADLTRLSLLLFALSLLALGGVLYGYVAKGKVYLLGIAAQGVGLLFAAPLLRYNLAMLTEPWDYAPFALAPYYAALLAALLYYLAVFWKRR